jgi:hypothetical protein
MEKWYEELSKISHVLQDTLNIRENVTRAKSGEERRLCVLLNRVDVLRVFISYLLKKDEGSIEQQISSWKAEVRYAVRKRLKAFKELQKDC